MEFLDTTKNKPSGIIECKNIKEVALMENLKEDDMENVTLTTMREMVKMDIQKDEMPIIHGEHLVYTSYYIDYNVFVVNNDMYSEEELRKNFKVHEEYINILDLFENQKVGVYFNRNLRSSLMDLTDLTFSVRPASSSVEHFIELGKAHRKPLHYICETNIYVARDKWKDFLSFRRVVDMASMVNHMQITNGDGSENTGTKELTIFAANSLQNKKILALEAANAELSEKLNNVILLVESMTK